MEAAFWFYSLAQLCRRKPHATSRAKVLMKPDLQFGYPTRLWNLCLLWECALNGGGRGKVPMSWVNLEFTRQQSGQATE